MQHNRENSNNTLSKSEQELRNGNIPRLFCKFAIPGVVGLLFLGIQTIIDGIILGNFVGANALASVSLILPCYSLLTAIAIVIAVGCQALVSMRLGQMNRTGANNALTSALLFNLVFSAVAALTIYIFAPHITRLLGANEVLMADSVSYLRALIPFYPALVIMFFSDSVLKTLGRTIYAMAVMSGTVIINILLDLLFVVEWEMGTAGAGLATGLAFTSGLLCSFPAVMLERTKVNLFAGRFSWRLVGRMFYNGSSEGISELSSGVSILLFNITMMKYLGEEGVAAYTALEYILFVSVTLFLGIANGIIPIVGYNHGAAQPHRIIKVVKIAAITNFIIGIALFITLTCWGEEIVRLFFQSGETRVMQIATQGTHIYAIAFLFNGLNILASSYFTALSNAKVSVIISLLRGLFLVAPMIILLPLLMGIEGIWLAVPVAEIFTLGVSIWLVRRSIKQSIRS